MLYIETEKHINSKEDFIMRHFYFRLVFGIIWLLAAIFSAISANFPFMALYIILGIVFLYSAYTIWKKERSNWR